jgi:hypothetical protein
VSSGISLDIAGHHWAAVLAALIVGLGLAYWAYRRTNPPLNRGLKVLMFILRTAVIALLGLAILEPILNLAWRRTEEPVVAVLIDRSASMSIPEGQADRLALARKLLQNDLAGPVESRGRLVEYDFSVTAQRREGDSLRADGAATDLTAALATVKQQLADENLTAVVLLTDGLDNLGRDPAREAQGYGRPIFPVGIGSAEPRRDIGISDLLTSEAVYKDDRVPVEVTVQSRGLEGLEVPVVLSAAGEVLDRRTITLGGEGLEQTVRLEYIPREEGLLRLQVSVPPQEGELTAENNRRELSVRVLKSKLRVLLLWGQPAWDFAFLRRSLEQDLSVEPTPLVFKGRSGYYLGQFPSPGERLREFDVFILGGSAAGELTAEQQSGIAGMVAGEGKGLLLVGGPDFRLDPGSPLAALSPLSAPAGRTGPVEDRFWLQLTAAGGVHPVMVLEEDALDAQQPWQDLPPFLGLNPMGPPVAGASVLAVHPQMETAGGALPLIAAGPAGTGKCLIVAVYPLWRWPFMLSGLGRSGRTYDRFWSNAVRWLATREEGRTIRVVPAQNVFHSGQRILFEGRIFDQSYRPLDRAQVKVTAWRKDDDQGTGVSGDLFASGRRDGNYRGELPALAPGEYRYRAEVSLGEQPIGGDEGRFMVEEYTLEFERIELNESLLREIARLSGGRYFPLDEAGELAGALPMPGREVSGSREVELWNHPLVLAALIVLLAAEWTLRKKNRLL